MAMRPEFDERDAAILARNQLAFDCEPGPRVGDFVVFACGTLRRISHMWRFDDVPREKWSVQTSDVGGCGWYFGCGYVSFSGSLYTSVKYDALVDTGDTREGVVWFFHHDWSEAHNAVYTKARFRLFRCSERAPGV